MSLDTKITKADSTLTRSNNSYAEVVGDFERNSIAGRATFYDVSVTGCSNSTNASMARLADFLLSRAEQTVSEYFPSKDPTSSLARYAFSPTAERLGLSEFNSSVLVIPAAENRLDNGKVIRGFALPGYNEIFRPDLDLRGDSDSARKASGEADYRLPSGFPLMTAPVAIELVTDPMKHLHISNLSFDKSRTRVLMSTTAFAQAGFELCEAVNAMISPRTAEDAHQVNALRRKPASPQAFRRDGILLDDLNETLAGSRFLAGMLVNSIRVQLFSDRISSSALIQSMRQKEKSLVCFFKDLDETHGTIREITLRLAGCSVEATCT